MTGAVICGIDESVSAPGAARVARELATRFEVPLVFVHVLPEGHTEADVRAAAELLRDADTSWSPGAGAQRLIEAGHPADRLVALASAQRATFIVLGCHGPRSSLLGSISADVSRRARCPVMIVPPDALPQLAALKTASFRPIQPSPA